MKHHILVIDDEPSFARVLKMALESTGKYVVKTANSASAALKIAKSTRPHLILLDIVMPDESGTSIAIQLQEDEQLKSIPIIFLTGTRLSPDTKATAKILSNITVLQKPIEIGEIIENMERHLIKGKAKR